MNIALWMLAGTMLGLVGFKFLNINEGRGMMISKIIGAAGGFFAGGAGLVIARWVRTLSDNLDITLGSLGDA